MGGLDGQQALCRREDFRHTGLVIGSQEGGAVGDNQMLAPVPGEAGEVRLLHHNALRLVQHNVSALIGDNPGVDVGPGGVGGRIHVGNETNDRLGRVPGHRAIDIALGIHVGVGNAHGPHLLHQGQGQRLLLIRGGAGIGKLVGLGVKLDITEQSFSSSHRKTSILKYGSPRAPVAFVIVQLSPGRRCPGQSSALRWWG